MSELFKQAVLEAQKLKEAAEIDAKNKVIAAVAPYIKKVISEQVSGVSEKEQFLFQEEEADGEVPVLNSSDAPLSDNSSLPITPIGGNILDLPMPDNEGKITVDFGQLFQIGNKETGGPVVAPSAGSLSTSPEQAPVAPIAPETPVSTAAPVAPEMPAETNPSALAPEVAPVASTEAPAPLPTEPESELQPAAQPLAESALVESFKKEVGLVAEKIGYVYFRKSIPTLVKESIKSKLFTLCENLDLLEEKCIISPKQARLAENKLDFLYKKLEEANEANIYESIEGDTMSQRLEEFAAKLFEEDALGPATADKAADHAKKTSGVKDDVDLMKEELLGEGAPASSAFGDGEEAKGAQTASPAVHDADALAKEKGDNTIAESAPASSAFGDGEKAKGAQTASPAVHDAGALADEEGDNVILEVSDTELQEEIRKLRKESIARKVRALREGAKLDDKKADEEDVGWQEGEPEKKASEAHKTVASTKVKTEAKAIKECGMEEEGLAHADVVDVDTDASDEVELTFKVNLKDLEALLADAEDGEAEIDLGGDVAGHEVADDEDEIEIVDDSSEEEGEEGEEEEEEEETEEEGKDHSNKMLMDKEAYMNENRKSPKAAKPLNEAQKALSGLKAQLVESQLLTAKALYLNKFSMREDLSRKQKQKIAEYLDGATTLAEAKETYAKIKRILDEAQTSKKHSGSSAKPVGSGSSQIIKENAGDNLVESSRWALLAGIKNKK